MAISFKSSNEIKMIDANGTETMSSVDPYISTSDSDRLVAKYTIDDNAAVDIITAPMNNDCLITWAFTTTYDMASVLAGSHTLYILISFSEYTSSVTYYDSTGSIIENTDSKVISNIINRSNGSSTSYYNMTLNTTDDVGYTRTFIKFDIDTSDLKFVTLKKLRRFYDLTYDEFTADKDTDTTYSLDKTIDADGNGTVHLIGSDGSDSYVTGIGSGNGSGGISEDLTTGDIEEVVS